VADVYSTQLVKAHALESGTIAVPLGQVWVVRTITVFYPTFSGGNVQLAGQTSAVTFFSDYAPPGELTAIWRYWTYLHLVLPNNEDYTLSGAGSPDVSLNGYALQLP
jgi:hypothetical protein